jgi:hypothetical protein
MCLPRVAFGLVLAGYGVNHYKNIGSFVEFSSSVVPALMIVGGVLFAVKQFKCLAKMCIVASLSGILGWAGLAVLLGDGSAGNILMPFIQNAAVLFVLYYIVKKMSCCNKGGCPCGKGAACACAPTPMK